MSVKPKLLTKPALPGILALLQRECHVAAGDALGWLVKFPVASGSSSSWLYQLTAPLQGLLSQFLGKRKLSRKLLQGGVDPPGGGGRGAPCGSWCYGR